MHDRLLAHSHEDGSPDFEAHARALGLDVRRFADDLRTHAHAGRVTEDVASADASGVAGTPSFFINGTRHQGAYDIENLTAAITSARSREQLRAAARV
jgi:predicted DsbA family dithiol-disulfide isomerase